MKIKRASCPLEPSARSIDQPLNQLADQHFETSFRIGCNGRTLALLGDHPWAGLAKPAGCGCPLFWPPQSPLSCVACCDGKHCSFLRRKIRRPTKGLSLSLPPSLSRYLFSSSSFPPGGDISVNRHVPPSMFFSLSLLVILRNRRNVSYATCKNTQVILRIPRAVCMVCSVCGLHNASRHGAEKADLRPQFQDGASYAGCTAHSCLFLANGGLAAYKKTKINLALRQWPR